jgi:hypothetical protein
VTRLGQVTAGVEERPALAFLAIGLLFAAAYVAVHSWYPRGHGMIINGDAISYYAWLRSLAVDGDLHFANDYHHFLKEPRPTDIGMVRNVVSIGPAILWAPMFVAVGLLSSLAGGDYASFDGFSAPVQIAIGLAGVGYATAGVWLCYDLARRVYPAVIAFRATVAIWLGGSAVYYSLVSPAYSHATALFAMALFCHTWFRTRGRYDASRLLLLGALGGLAALTRWQDVIILALPGIELLQALRAGACTRLRFLGGGLALAMACAVVLTPQFVVWHAVFGQFIVSPGGDSHMQWGQFAMPSTLFSLRQGLFTWTPVMLPAVVGLWWLTRRDAVLGWSAVAILLLATYINGSVSDWWGSAAFGARRFISYSPFFVLGLAALMNTGRLVARPTLTRTAVLAIIGCNLLFLLQYQLFMRGLTDIVPAYPGDFWSVFIERFIVPVRLIGGWIDP